MLALVIVTANLIVKLSSVDGRTDAVGDLGLRCWPRRKMGRVGGVVLHGTSWHSGLWGESAE